MSNNKDFVVAEVQGNLGNWIFGYMFAHVWAKRNGISNVYVKPEMPLYYKQIKYYDKLKDTVFRNLNLILNVPQGIQLYAPQMWYTEEDFSWIEQKDNIMFGGVVQCYNIYKDYHQDFIEIFGPTQEIKDEIFHLYGNLSDTVGFNVRRGDFLDYTNYWVYNEAEILFILEKYCSGKKVIITSDDIEWCKNNIKFPNVIFADKKSEHYNKIAIDFYLNQLCGENIISAGSTFSWLCAWFNTVHGGECSKVYCPEHWVKEVIDLEKNSDNMVLDSWTKIILDKRNKQ